MTNLLVNPSLEDWTAGVPDGWSYVATGASTVTKDTGIFRTGLASAHWVSDSGGNNARIYQQVPISPGQIVTCSFWHYGGTSAKSYYVYFTALGPTNYNLQSDGTWAVGGPPTWNPVFVGSVWTPLSVTSVAVPAGVTAINFECGPTNATNNWNLDDISIDDGYVLAAPARRSSVRRA